MKKLYRTRDVCGIKVADVTLRSIIDIIEAIIKSGGKKTFYGANVHALNYYQKNEELKEAFDSASFIYPEGMGIVMLSHASGTPLKSKTTLMDYIFEVFQLAEKKKWPVYILGGSSKVLQDAIKNLKKAYPALKITGRNGYIKKGENEQVLKEINLAKPMLLFVAMGTPQQEMWIHNNMESLNAVAYFGIGGSLDVIAGRMGRAPEIMHSYGFEWAYRFYKEPKRLWRRTLSDNSFFVLEILKVLYKK